MSKRVDLKWTNVHNVVMNTPFRSALESRGLTVNDVSKKGIDYSTVRKHFVGTRGIAHGMPSSTRDFWASRGQN